LSDTNANGVKIIQKLSRTFGFLFQLIHQNNRKKIEKPML
jgi:hypothetical protein